MNYKMFWVKLLKQKLIYSFHVENISKTANAWEDFFFYDSDFCFCIVFLLVITTELSQFQLRYFMSLSSQSYSNFDLAHFTHALLGQKKKSHTNILLDQLSL